MAGALHTLSQKIPLEDQSINDYLSKDVFTDPKFQKNRKKADIMLHMRYYEDAGKSKHRKNIIARSVVGDTDDHKVTYREKRLELTSQ